MARKNLLSGLAGAELSAGNFGFEPGAASSPSLPPTPHFGVMGARGAIGAVTRSIEQLKAQSIVDLDPSMVDESFISDRLGGASADLDELVSSIREHGQQVPILVRPHPERVGRYQIAYGRRRLRAVTQLDKKIRAIVKPLSDQQLVVAQGQENSARTDLSFIEKARFAAKLESGGFDRDTIMAALSVDKTGLSRLISVAVKIPDDIVELIGPAPKAGRDRWLALSLRLERRGAADLARTHLATPEAGSRTSDERFNKLFDGLAEKKPKSGRASIWKAFDGKRVARIKDDERNLTLILDKKVAPTFGAYLVENLPEIYAAFKSRGDV
jgi:ParB family transcriptional regulator, chromosome partitioning protein